MRAMSEGRRDVVLARRGDAAVAESPAVLSGRPKLSNSVRAATSESSVARSRDLKEAASALVEKNSGF